MKNSLLFGVCNLLISFSTLAQSLNGAWKKVDAPQSETVSIIEDNYFMQAIYSKDKLFYGTLGGACQVNNDGTINITLEFDTLDSTMVGQRFTVNYKLENNRLTIDIDGEKSYWDRIDDGQGALAGNWRITEREQNGKMAPMRPGPRKTLKILSGNRFQWAAINPQTKEFFGTGGGTYTFANGQYTETIGFFSRDSTRVGMQLSFEGKVEGKRWHHSGKSSKGDPISEIWTRQN